MPCFQVFLWVIFFITNKITNEIPFDPDNSETTTLPTLFPRQTVPPLREYNKQLVKALLTAAKDPKYKEFMKWAQSIHQQAPRRQEQLKAFLHNDSMATKVLPDFLKGLSSTPFPIPSEAQLIYAFLEHLEKVFNQNSLTVNP